jgi:hypothetical protein
MSNYETEEAELTIPQGINEKKSRMAEYALGILPNKSNISSFIPNDRHTLEPFIDTDGNLSHAIVKKPRR